MSIPTPDYTLITPDPRDAGAVWAHGHETGFWNGVKSRETGADPDTPVGAAHARANNPFDHGWKDFGTQEPDQLPAGDLSLRHVGKRVTVTSGETSATGVLYVVEHKADALYENNVMGKGSMAIGRTWTRVTIIPGIDLTLDPTSMVIIQA